MSEEMMYLLDRCLDVFGEIIRKYDLKGMTKGMLKGIYRRHYPTDGRDIHHLTRTANSFEPDF